MAMHYRVGAFARLTGVTVRTLHHYDQIGLLRPALRNEGGQRLYREEDLLVMEQINGLRSCGFALEAVMHFAGAVAYHPAQGGEVSPRNPSPTTNSALRSAFLTK